jgi:hypothetical protein
VPLASSTSQGWPETGCILFLFLALFIGISGIFSDLYRRILEHKEHPGTDLQHTDARWRGAIASAMGRKMAGQRVVTLICLGIGIVFGIVWLAG